MYAGKIRLRAQNEVDGSALERHENAGGAVQRFVNGVATILELDKNKLIKYMPKFLPQLLMQESRREDVASAVEDAVVHILDAFSDHEAWDSYYTSHAPSAYMFAAAVAAWMYLYSEHYGSAIPIGCPLFSEAVKAAVAEFFATKTARPITESVARIRDFKCWQT
ncbi:MAG: hypothetical protein ACO2PN_21760 [Pyrobaculum sp.]|jgi:hypothetical protein